MTKAAALRSLVDSCTSSVCRQFANLSIAFACILPILFAATFESQAAEIEVNDTCSLADAIRSANTNAAVGGCAAGDDTSSSNPLPNFYENVDIISIRRNVTLAAPLPAIESRIAVHGNFHTVDGDNKTRIFNVTSGGLGIFQLAITKGLAENNQGGAIKVTGSADLEIRDSSVRDSATSGTSSNGIHGGGIYFNSSGRLVIIQSLLSGNAVGSSTAYGGGVYLGSNSNDSSNVLSRSHIISNRASRGAGLYVAGGATLNLYSSVFDRNMYPFSSLGGGIFNDGSLTVENTTLLENGDSRSTTSEGAGLHHTGNGALDLWHVSIINNRGGYGLKVAGSSNVEVKSSLIYRNQAGDCDGALTVNTNNFIGDGSCFATGLRAGDPKVVVASWRINSHWRGMLIVRAAFPYADSPVFQVIPLNDCNLQGKFYLRRYLIVLQGEPGWEWLEPITGDEKCSIGAVEGPASDFITVSAPAPTQVPARVPPTAVPLVTPTTSTGKRLNDDPDDGIEVRATQGLDSGIQFQRRDAGVVMMERAQNIEAVVNAGIREVVEVWGNASQPAQVCFDNASISSGGGIMFIDKSEPGSKVDTGPPTISNGSQTCINTTSAGIVVLVDNAPADAAPATATPVIQAAPLSNCMVTTANILNLRASPGGNVIGLVPYNVTLTALQKASGWYQVDLHGQIGWISADYASPKQNCG